MAQRDQVLDWLGRGWQPSKVRDALREAGGPTIALSAVVGYLQRHGEEIAMKQAAWMARLRDEPLANIRDRLRERTKMYSVTVVSLFRELCPKCGGEGTLPVLRTPKDEHGRAHQGAEPIQGTIHCERCRGRKWILPDAMQQAFPATGGDVRFDTVPTLPPVVEPERLEACRDILRQIREEVGDAWSPREKSARPDGALVPGDVNTVILDVDKQSYIAKLRAMRGAPPLPPPTLEVSPAPSDGNGGPPTLSTT